jgi:hypothetical protein
MRTTLIVFALGGFAALVLGVLIAHINSVRDSLRVEIASLRAEMQSEFRGPYGVRPRNGHAETARSSDAVP